MRITHISDTHLSQYDLSLPGGDILVHSGDLGIMGAPAEYKRVFAWFESQMTKYLCIIVVPGNHDKFLDIYNLHGGGDEMKAQLTKMWSDFTWSGDRHILVDSSITISGVTFYGSPWTPRRDSRYNAYTITKGERIAEKWDKIPRDLDILVTHAAPFGYLDFDSNSMNNVGCEQLRKRVEEVRPRIHLFGHIHDGYGYTYNEHTNFFNAAVLPHDHLSFTKLRDPITFDYNKSDNSIEILNHGSLINEKH